MGGTAPEDGGRTFPPDESGWTRRTPAAARHGRGAHARAPTPSHGPHPHLRPSSPAPAKGKRP